jgi:two-component system response regulator GlrR
MPARDGMADRLRAMNVSVTATDDVREALEALASHAYALCLVDLAGEATALSAIRLVRAQHPLLPLAGVADLRRPAAAGEALHAGVVDVLPWPFDEHDFAAVLANARDRTGLDPAGGRPGVSDRDVLVAHSPAMRAVLDEVAGAAAERGGVYLSGEPGTGRGLVARAIHVRADAAQRPFVIIDCAADLPQLEQRLFGETPGRRSSTNGNGLALERLGRGAALLGARGGTLLLRRVSDAPARVQARLARLLRDGEALLDRRGPIEIDVRPMAASEPGLDAAVTEGRLRRDLYDRIAQRRIEIPPLRRRREDIPLLAAHYLNRLAAAEGRPPRTFSRSAFTLLAALPWHGNAPELFALLERICRSTSQPVLQLEDLLQHATLDGIAARIDAGVTLRDAKAAFERECISAVLRRHHGRVGEAAKALGIQRTNLYRKVRQLNMGRSLLARR